jgi:perosamine synthetase
MIYCCEPQVSQLERQYVAEVLASGRLTEGQWVRSFGDCLSKLINRPAMPVSSGTAALHIALLAVGVHPGDEVIVPATTYVATANAALLCGATVRVCDVDNRSWTIDPTGVASLLNDKTSAVVPVHLYGVPADVNAIQGELELHYRRTGRRVAIVEDCAEALGAATPAGAVGALGDAAAFSFYGSKTITAGGEGGAVAWTDYKVGRRAWHVSHQSMTSDRYFHDCLGFNYRMTEVQGAFGVAQISRLSEFLDKRRQVFEWYDQRLGSIRKQELNDLCTHGRWAYAVMLPAIARRVAEHMLAAGVETRPVFPPMWTLPHVGNGDAVQNSNAGHIHLHGLVLPTHCGLTKSNVDAVCQELFRAIEKA